MYLVTTNWSGALHIDPMRLFPDLELARKYGADLHGGTVRIYLLSATSPPKLIK